MNKYANVPFVLHFQFILLFVDFLVKSAINTKSYKVPGDVDNFFHSQPWRFDRLFSKKMLHSHVLSRSCLGGDNLTSALFLSVIEFDFEKIKILSPYLQM